MIRVRPSAEYTDSPIPMHSCRSLSSFWQPTLRSQATSKMNVSASVSFSRFARALLIVPYALACLNDLVRAQYYQYPLDSPGNRSNFMTTIFRAKSLGSLRKNFMDHRDFSIFDILSVFFDENYLFALVCFSTRANIQKNWSARLVPHSNLASVLIYHLLSLLRQNSSVISGVVQLTSQIV